MERFKIIYIDTVSSPGNPIIVQTNMAVHSNVAVLAPDGLTPLLAIVVDLETGKAASLAVTTIREARSLYTEAGTLTG